MRPVTSFEGTGFPKETLKQCGMRSRCTPHLEFPIHKKAEVALVTSGVEMDVMGLPYELHIEVLRPVCGSGREQQ